MGQAEGVPEDDVGVVDRFAGRGGVGDPGWEPLRGLAGGLGDVSACGVDLVVRVCWKWRVLETKRWQMVCIGGLLLEGGRTFRDMHSVPCEASSSPDEAIFLG